MHVDRPGQPGDGGANPFAEHGLPARPAADADHDHGGVDTAGEVQDGFGHVVADDGMESSAEALDQLPLMGERGRRSAG